MEIMLCETPYRVASAVTMPRRCSAFLIASTIAEVSFAWPLRLLIVGRGCFRIYRASSVLASRPGSCDRRHKLGFEKPIIFWTQREAPLL